MRTLLTRLILLGIGLALLSGCAITHKFGPYNGKVVDMESGEPIEGAVVFLRFFSEFGFSPGGAMSRYADALETFTDSNGEYSVPPHRVTVFHVGSMWDDDNVMAIIFKPGYGAYNGWMRDKEGKIFKLPKLKTREERRLNLSNVMRYSKFEIPCDKQRHIQRYYNIERISLGLEATKYCKED